MNNKDNYIFFWGHQPSKDGKITKSCLSQWWESPFTIYDITYSTAEHYMMAMKADLFRDYETFTKIINTPSPSDVKKLGREIKNYDDVHWNDLKYRIVFNGNYHKFSKNPELKEFLLSTGDKILVEASPYDTIWGIGMSENDEGIENPENWKGQNLLGKVLMDVRYKLMKEYV